MTYMFCHFFILMGTHDFTDSRSYTAGLVFLRFTLEPLLHPKSVVQLSTWCQDQNSSSKDSPFFCRRRKEHCIDCVGPYLICIESN